VDGRDVDSDLLEHAAVHDRHHAAAAVAAAMVDALPGRAHESSRWPVGQRSPGGEVVFHRLEGGGDAVAQVGEPGGGFGLPVFGHGASSVAELWAGRKPPVCRRASPRTMAAAVATLIERKPGTMGTTTR